MTGEPYDWLPRRATQRMFRAFSLFQKPVLRSKVPGSQSAASSSLETLFRALEPPHCGASAALASMHDIKQPATAKIARRTRAIESAPGYACEVTDCGELPRARLIAIIYARRIEVAIDRLV